MTLPNFFVIGTGKCGTTSLYHYLKQHPQIYMSPLKEPDFFRFEGEPPCFKGPGDERYTHRVITRLEDYRALFAGVSDEPAIGEASQSYLRPKAAHRIRHYIPEAKLIAVLRDPVERAYSAYLALVRDGREWLDFDGALKEEEARAKANWHGSWRYRHGGFYCSRLRRYYELFGRDQIRVYLYEDLKGDPVGMTHDIFRFLEVDDTFVPDTSLRYNVSGIPRSRALHTFLNRPNRLKTVVGSVLPGGPRNRLSANMRNRNLTEPPPLPESTRKELTDAYREDILELQDLIGRDLSGWLSEERVTA
jgi:Sulfotransferase family